MGAVSLVNVATTQDELDTLRTGTVIYYKVFYDGLRHVMAERYEDGLWLDAEGIPVVPTVPVNVLHEPAGGDRS